MVKPSEVLADTRLPLYKGTSSNFGHWIPQWGAPNGERRPKAFRVEDAGRAFLWNALGVPADRIPRKDVPPTQAQILAAQQAYPHYDIQGPGKYLIAGGQSGLHGDKRRLMAVRYGVYSIEEAASACDHTPGCTQFSVTVGPYDKAMPWETWQAYPGRALLLRGPMASSDAVQGEVAKYAFIGLRRGKAAESPYDLDPGVGPFPSGAEGPLVPAVYRQQQEIQSPWPPDFDHPHAPPPGRPVLPGPKSGGTGWAGGIYGEPGPNPDGPTSIAPRRTYRGPGPTYNRSPSLYVVEGAIPCQLLYLGTSEQQQRRDASSFL